MRLVWKAAGLTWAGGRTKRRISDQAAQNEPTSQDVPPLAQRGRGLPPRRNAPALRAQPDETQKRNDTLYCNALTGSSATAPRSLRGFTYGDGQAELTADFYAENQPCHCVPSSVKAFGAA